MEGSLSLNDIGINFGIALPNLKKSCKFDTGDKDIYLKYSEYYEKKEQEVIKPKTLQQVTQILLIN